MRRLNFLLPLLLIIAIVISFIPSPVYAVTQDRAIKAAPNGEGSQTDGTYVGGTTNSDNLNSDDSATSYLKTVASGTFYHCYDMLDFSTSYTSISSVTLLVKARYSGGVFDLNYVTPYVRIGGTNYYGTGTILSGSFVEYTKQWTTNPATGTAWTSTTLNAAEFGFRTEGVATSEEQITYMKITVDYTALTLPSVTATAPTTYTDTSATLIGNITATGGETPDNYGFVWGTVDQGDPGNLAPADGIGGWTKGWAVGAGSYGVAQYTHAIGATLTKNTTYYIRFAAHNSVGWEYSSVVSFRTLTDPSITTLAATNVASVSARLNASVVDDGKLGGGENCTVVFVYKANAAAHYANYAAILAAGGTEVTATGTYNTGGLPYYDIGSLVVSTNYDFAVKITNSVSTQYGLVLYFVTESGVAVPTNFVAIPTSTTVSLSWVKGVGSSNTFIRYDTATYPTVITGGLGTIYAGTGNSYSMTALTPGQSYYFSAWGLAGGTYSATYAQIMATCLATGAAGIPVLPTPTTPGSWDLTPSTAAVSNMPFSEFVNYFADSYSIPRTSMWYGLIIIFSVWAGLFAYWRGNNNLFAGMLLCAIGLAIGAIVWELVYLWVLVFFLMAGVSMVFFAQRYP